MWQANRLANGFCTRQCRPGAAPVAGNTRCFKLFQILMLQPEKYRWSSAPATAHRRWSTASMPCCNLSDTDFELVIVDNAPDNNSTQQLVQKYPDVVYVRENRKGLDIARNTGARTASCPVVAYTDDDVTVERGLDQKHESLL
jgi:hypothetical protein